MDSVSVTQHDDCELREYLKAQYQGIFDEAAIESHIRDYVGFGFSNGVAPLVAQQVSRGELLDIGCGFGAFVVAARRLGLDAVGVEIAPFEVEYARKRLKKEMPELDPLLVYYLGDGHAVPFADETFDAVTLWNVLEHVPDGKRLLSEAARVLKPNGIIFIICPNYAAFRQEAHYLVPWFPLLPRKLASLYLQLHGRDPRFFETSIFYRTNWDIQRALRQLGLQVSWLVPSSLESGEIEASAIDARNKIWQPNLLSDGPKRTLFTLMKKLHLRWALIIALNVIVSLRYVVRWWKRNIDRLRLYNPFVQSIILSARKVVE